jgi:hypothetical protein
MQEIILDLNHPSYVHNNIKIIEYPKLTRLYNRTNKYNRLYT